MDEKALKRLLRAKEPTTGRPGWGCLDDVRLAAYVEHRVSAQEESRIESHLADCDVCLDQAAFLVRQPEAGERTVAPDVLERARDLVASRPSIWFTPVLRWGTVAAAAACLVLVVSLELRQPVAPPLPGAPPSSGPAVPSAPASEPTAAVPPVNTTPAPAPPPARVRNSVATPAAVALVSPEENATLSLRALEFRWQPVSGALYYEVHILTEDGNVAWQGKADATSTRLPDGHPLQPGVKYFVWVRAYLSGGGTVRSAAVAFHVGGS